MATNQDLDLTTTAELLGVPPQAVARWVRKGVLPSTTRNGKSWFDRRKVSDWADRMGMRLREPKNRPLAATPSEPEEHPILAAIHRGGLLPELPGDSVETVLATMLERIVLPEGLERAALESRLLERERLGTTGVGDGVAAPHPRQPLTEAFPEPRIWVARLPQPVAWNAIDGQPVSLVLLLCSSSLKNHLAMLSSIAHVLRTPKLRQDLEEAENLEDLLLHLEADLGA